jgi:hypothetical protein
MALEIKSPPVLRGKAAKEFYEKAAKMTERKSAEEVQAISRKWKPFLAKYYNPYRNV